jgi:hypothetical protein
MSQFGLSFTQCGLLTTVFFLVSGVGQALAGFVVGRIGALPGQRGVRGAHRLKWPRPVRPLAAVVSGVEARFVM